MLQLLAMGALSGCAPDSTPPPQGVATASDSAGVRIVQSTGGTWGEGEAWRIEAETHVQIGSVLGDDNDGFGFVTGAVRLTDGRVAVLDGQSRTMRVYAPDGEYVEDWARPGPGPGELPRGWLGMAWLTGDTVLVTTMDGAHLFADDGTFVRRDRVPLATMLTPTNESTARTWAPYGVIGRMRDASYVASLGGTTAQGPGRHVEQVGIARFLPDGPGDTLLFAEGEAFERVREDDGFHMVGTHFARRVTAVVSEMAVLVNRGQTYGYSVYSEAGHLELVARLLWRRTPVDRALQGRWREYRSQWWGRVVEPGVPVGRAQQVFEATPYPDSLPALYDLRVDRSGHVWGEGSQDSQWPAPSRVHYVFGPSGAFLGVVEVPEGLRVLDIGDEYILGVWRDENDVDFIRVHRIVK